MGYGMAGGFVLGNMYRNKALKKHYLKHKNHYDDYTNNMNVFKESALQARNRYNLLSANESAGTIEDLRNFKPKSYGSSLATDVFEGKYPETRYPSDRSWLNKKGGHSPIWQHNENIKDLKMQSGIDRGPTRLTRDNFLLTPQERQDFHYADSRGMFNIEPGENPLYIFDLTKQKFNHNGKEEIADMLKYDTHDAAKKQYFSTNKKEDPGINSTWKEGYENSLRSIELENMRKNKYRPSIPLPQMNKCGGVVKMAKGGEVKSQFQGNYLDVMGYGLPVFNFGGIIKDIGLNNIDAVTSIVNKDIIKDDMYSTKVGRDISNVTGGIINTAAPAAAGLLLGPAGSMGMQAIQIGSNQFVRPSDRPSDTGRVMNSLDPFLRMGASAGAAAYSSANSSTNAVPKKAEGGPIDEKTLINVEGGELEVDPSGKIIKHFRNKPQHPAYGIDAKGNTMSTLGNIIIPKYMAKEYEKRKGDSVYIKTALANLRYKQSLREKEEAMNSMQIAKGGGKVKKYGGDEGSIVGPINTTGPRVDLGEYDPNYGMPIHGMRTLGSSKLPFNFISPQPEYNANQYFPELASSKMPINIPDTTTPSTTTPSTTTSSDWQELSGGQKAGYIAGKVGTYLPALYNVGRSLFDKSYQMNPQDYMVNPDTKFEDLKGEAGRLDMRNAFNASRRSIRNMGSGSAQLQGQLALANRMFESLGKFNENLENTNKMGRFEAAKFNKGLQGQNAQMRLGVDTFNEQSRANRRNFGAKGIEQTSQLLQNERNNNLMMSYLKSAYPGFDINKFTGESSYNSQPNTNPVFKGPYTPSISNTNSGMAFNTMWTNYFKNR